MKHTDIVYTAILTKEASLPLGALGAAVAPTAGAITGAFRENPNARATDRFGGFLRGAGRGTATGAGAAAGGLAGLAFLGPAIASKTRFGRALAGAAHLATPILGAYGGDRLGKKMFGEYGYNKKAAALPLFMLAGGARQYMTDDNPETKAESGIRGSLIGGGSAVGAGFGGGFGAGLAAQLSEGKSRRSREYAVLAGLLSGALGGGVLGGKVTQGLLGKHPKDREEEKEASIGSV